MMGQQNEEKLRTNQADLSEVDFDAFISYCHTSLDRVAARQLQRKLEHFRAPRGISDRKYPFHRVFLDEGELSSCADFGSQIEAALKNATWLIVICSPQTPKSPWVEKEIQTFIQYHDRAHVLALLTDGTPAESFPSLLKGDGLGHGEVLAADVSGVGHGSLSHGEQAGPGLSDEDKIRLVKKSIHGDAFLKLAAPMLGITFDTLKQRRKLWVMQRAALIGGLVFCALFIFTLQTLRLNLRISRQNQDLESKNRQINEQNQDLADKNRQINEQNQDLADKNQKIEEQNQNLEEKNQTITAQKEELAQQLKNNTYRQSKFLVSEAQRQLDQNRVIDALQLAMESLPDKENPDRPDLAEAEYVLQQATGAYVSPSESKTKPVGIFESKNPIESWVVSEDGNYLITSDSMRIQVWDPQTHTVLHKLEIPGVKLEEDLISQDDHEIIFWNESSSGIEEEEGIFCYRFDKGEIAWKQPYDTSEGTIDSGVINQKDGTVLFIKETDVYDDSLNAGYLLTGLSLKDGEETLSVPVPNTFAKTASAEENGEVRIAIGNFVNDLAVSEDGTYAAFDLTLADTEDETEGDDNWIEEELKYSENDVICLVNLETKECSLLQDPGMVHVYNIAFTPDSQLLAASTDGSAMVFISSANTREYKNRTHTIISCFDLAGGESVWSQTLAAEEAGELPMQLCSYSDQPAVIVSYGSQFAILDRSTGEVLDQKVLGGRIIGSWMNSGETAWEFVTADGRMNGISLSQEDSSSWVSATAYPQGMTQCIYNSGRSFLASRNSQDQLFQILEYDNFLYDPNWTLLMDEMETDYNGFLPPTLITGADDSIVAISSSMDDQVRIWYFEEEDGQVLLKQELEFSDDQFPIAEHGFLGTRDGHKTLYMQKDRSKEEGLQCLFYYLDLENGKTGVEGFPSKGNDWKQEGILIGNQSYFLYKPDQEDGRTWRVCRFGPGDQEPEVVYELDEKIADTSRYNPWNISYSEDGKYLLVGMIDTEMPDQLNYYCLDLSQKSFSEIGKYDRQLFGEDGMRLVGNRGISAIGLEEQILIFDADGKQVGEIPVTLDGQEAGSIQFTPDNQSLLVLYSGGSASRTVLAVYDTQGDLTETLVLPEGDYDPKWYFTQDNKLILDVGSCYIVNLEEETFGLAADTDIVTGYDPLGDRFFTFDFGVFGYFERYSLEELMQKAAGMLGEQTP